MDVQENKCRIHCRGNQYLTGLINYGELVKKRCEVEQLKCEVLEKSNDIQAGNDGVWRLMIYEKGSLVLI